ncbi:TetR/AcrR family transcriptional regulator [Speluncibacter jeojiensis]|uniref:TetR/AcrR family transcriptional regulator n=1 Tax=Speluncibacter jeojiensis TaxID=2710754 RepID=A0A9X4LZ40_9ACTN|nr:TetR/AcrR family transcriptional regulator [Rhodococcus sp. D2-41]MDG3013862.1 TetR/AcrR family transcriptional regulator [Corynebacteriales bacterium D3-21]
MLATAYPLFAQRGVRGVGIDEIIAQSGVAKATLYRHFPSKDDLVLAFLSRREQLWTVGIVQRGARERADTPEAQLLAIFDVFADWFARTDFESCSFINVLLEMGPVHPAGKASIGYLEHIRTFVAQLAREASLADPDEFAKSFHILMKGAIIAAAEGDPQAAMRAKSMACALIERSRPPVAPCADSGAHG